MSLYDCITVSIRYVSRWACSLALRVPAFVRRIEPRLADLGCVPEKIALEQNGGDRQADEKRGEKGVPHRISSDTKLIPKRHRHHQQYDCAASNSQTASGLVVAHLNSPRQLSESAIGWKADAPRTSAVAIGRSNLHSGALFASALFRLVKFLLKYR
jgi:hypothetical protein